MIIQTCEVIPVKGVITQSLDAAVIFYPFAAKRLPGFPALLGGVMRISCAEYYLVDKNNGDLENYIDHGGNDPNAGKQVGDQSWNLPGNKALIVSEMYGLLVRVTLGFKH